MIEIDVINACTVLGDAEIPPMIAAIQQQVSRDFVPAWAIADAHLNFIPKGGKPNATHWWVSLLDDSDTAGALGYHDKTNHGLPLAKVFAKTDQQYGSKVPVTLSHEVLEMLGDPYCATNIERVVGGRSIWYAFEACDAVEDDSLAYLIGGVPVSDFVLPSWFERTYAVGQKDFSFRGNVHKPFQLAKGGYQSIYDATKGGWTQATFQTAPGGSHHLNPEEAAPIPYEARGRVGSRRERRRVGRANWACSQVPGL